MRRYLGLALLAGLFLALFTPGVASATTQSTKCYQVTYHRVWDAKEHRWETQQSRKQIPCPPTTKTYTLQANNSGTIPIGNVGPKNSKSLNINGTTQWAPPCGSTCSTTYSNSTITTATIPCNTDCQLPGAPVGAVLYRVAGGAWTAVDGSVTITGTGLVELAYNDDFFDDNTGSYTIDVTTTNYL